MAGYRKVRTERGIELVWEARSAAMSFGLYAAFIAAIGEMGRARHGTQPKAPSPDSMVASR